MILSFTGDVEKARQMMRWLHDNVASASKPDLAPSYASFLNSTVRWDAANRSWYVSCHTRNSTIDVQLPDDKHLVLHYSLLWTG